MKGYVVKIFKRIVGVLVIILASLGILLSAVGIVGVWLIKSNTQDAMLSIFSSVGGVLQTADNALGGVNTKLQSARDDLAAVGDTAQQLGNKAIQATPARDLILSRLSDQSFPKIQSALDTATNVRDTAVAANELITTLNRIPGVSLPTLPGGRFQPLVDQLTAATTAAQQLRDSVRNTKAEAINSTVSTLTDRTKKLDSRLADAQASVSETQDQIKGVEARVMAAQTSVPRLLTIGAIGLTLVLLWLLLSQVSMLLFGWSYLRRSDEEPA
jgi:uncharacterized phage infection (PIP) family protein YhgE